MAKPLEDFSTDPKSSSSVIPAGSTVVQCPGCRTRFAVDKRSINQAEFPRFHCSRCDHVFSLGEGQAATPEAPHLSQALEQFEAASKRAASSAEGMALQIPREFPDAIASSAPHEALNAERELCEPQMAFGFSSRGAAVSKAAENDQLNWLKEPEIDSAVRPSSARELFDRDLPNPLPEILNAHSLELPPNKTLSGWRALVASSVPILLVLLLLGALGMYVPRDSFTARILSMLSFSTQAQPAPAGLTLNESAFRTIALDSGEEISLVEGKLENQTVSDFKHVRIETVLFDRSGTAVFSKITSLGSGLAHSRIKSLSTEMIQKMQTGAPTRKAALLSGAGSDFAIAFTANELAGIKPEFYSARIYSVE